MSDVLKLISEVGFPIVAAMASGYLVFLTIKFILDGGRSRIGLESTIISLINKPKIMSFLLIHSFF